MKASIRAYYQLTKPGIVYGNALSATGGFLLASKGQPRLELFMATLVGISSVVASACVINNYIDRGIDSKMKRTKSRALVTGQISDLAAIVYGSALGIIGFGSLILFTNTLVAGLAAAGYFFYIVMYGIWKRRSPIGTVVGSVSGAIPLVVGYCAVTSRFDTGALLLFLILTCWQMPHFYSIAIFRAKEYKSASIPVLPIVKGAHATKFYILSYIVGFMLCIALLGMYGYVGYGFLILMLALSSMWLLRGLNGLKTHDNESWARGMFKFSLIVLLGLCLMLSFNAWTS